MNKQPGLLLEILKYKSVNYIMYSLLKFFNETSQKYVLQVNDVIKLGRILIRIKGFSGMKDSN